MTGPAVPCGGEAVGERYAGKERRCFMATAAAGALLREACTNVDRHKDQHEPKPDVFI